MEKVPNRLNTIVNLLRSVLSLIARPGGFRDLVHRKYF